jgi:hypothetical protein
MSQLVQDDRGEQPKCRDRPHRPVEARGQVWIIVGEDPRGEGPGDQHGEDQPGPVEADLKACEPEEGDGSAEHLMLPNSEEREARRGAALTRSTSGATVPPQAAMPAWHWAGRRRRSAGAAEDDLCTLILLRRRERAKCRPAPSGAGWSCRPRISRLARFEASRQSKVMDDGADRLSRLRRPCGPARARPRRW